MTTSLRGLGRIKGAVGTLLAGVFLLCAAGAAPSAHVESNRWRDAVSAPAAPAATLRSTDAAARSVRSTPRVEPFAAPRPLALAVSPVVAFATDPAATAGPSRSIVGRGYDATAPPRFS